MASTPPQLQNISIKVDDNGVALIKFNRSRAANALNKGVFKDLTSATSWALSDRDIRVVVLSGEGKFFTAGMDLMDGVNDDPETVIPDETINALDTYHKLLIHADKVLIAAVNGPGIGYGTSSIALFDLVYAVPEAYFFTPFVKWGLGAEACSSVSLAKIMGRQKASSLILADERMSAQELERAGLITKIIPAEHFLPEVLRIADRIARLPPQSLKLNKELMMKPLKQDLLDANEAELKLLRQRAREQESKDAIKAFAVEQKKKRDENKSKL